MPKGIPITEDQEYFIIANWDIMTNKEIAETLGISRDAVSVKGGKLGLCNKRSLNEGRKFQPSSQIEDYGPSPETLQEAEARKKTLELLRIKEAIKENNSLKVKVKGEVGRSKSRLLDGVVIQKNNAFITLKLKNYRESFKYTDFYTGRAVIV